MQTSSLYHPGENKFGIRETKAQKKFCGFLSLLAYSLLYFVHRDKEVANVIYIELHTFNIFIFWCIKTHLI